MGIWRLCSFVNRFFSTEKAFVRFTFSVLSLFFYGRLVGGNSLLFLHKCTRIYIYLSLLCVYIIYFAIFKKRKKKKHRTQSNTSKPFRVKDPFEDRLCVFFAVSFSLFLHFCFGQVFLLFATNGYCTHIFQTRLT